MELKSLRALLIDELQEIYISETLVEQEFGRMVRGADAKELKDAFSKHVEETKEQLERLNHVFALLKENPRGGRSRSMKALLEEAEDRMGNGGNRHVVDAALIAIAQRIKHWEIAAYGTAQTFAALLTEAEIAELLGKTLAEEKATDGLLTKIAEEVNVGAKTTA